MVDAPRDERTLRAYWAVWLVISVCIFLAGVSIAPQIHVAPKIAFFGSFACIATCVIGTGRYAPNLGTPGLQIAALCASALFAIAWIRDPLFFLTRATLVTAILLCGGTLVGAWVGGRVKDAGHLLPLGMVMSAADLFSVFHEQGPSSAILANERALSVLAIPFALAGTDAIEPFLGVGDVIGATLFLAASRKHRLDVRRTVIALGAGFALAAGAVRCAQLGF